MESWREKVLVRFTPNPADFWTVDDAMKGTSILGGTGSGKTSASGKTIARKFLEEGWGGLVLCAKTDEAASWYEYSREAGRLDDFILFQRGAVHVGGEHDGKPFIFNPLHYEMNRSGEGAKEAQNITNIFMNIYRMGNRIAGDGDTKEERFWDTALKRCLNRTIELINLAGEELTYKNMVNVIFSADGINNRIIKKAADQLRWTDSEDEIEEVEAENEEIEEGQGGNDKGNENTDSELDLDDEGYYCLKCIAKAYLSIAGEDDHSPRVNAFGLAHQYFTQTFPGLGEKARTTITESFMGLAEPFLSGLLYEHFSGVSNIFPEDIFTKSKIIVLNFPVKEFLEAGIMAQCIFKLIFQQAVERRDVSKHPKPAFLWADEAQYFVNPYDQIFLTTARSSRTATVFLSQNISNYLVVMGSGPDAKPKVDSLMGNLSTKIFHSNSDAETNEYASRLIGSAKGEMKSASHSQQFLSLNISTSDGYMTQIIPQIQPMRFTMLKSGGVNFDYIVDAVIFVTGKKWSGGTNFIETFFKQSFETSHHGNFIKYAIQQ